VNLFTAKADHVLILLRLFAHGVNPCVPRGASSPQPELCVYFM